ncbi:MAG TPA: DUF362 domain-containing protein [Candidatus Avalokitesvara rifleensis]|uniref:DUF362 domain-containing protein n=1 Tax=Candidatus Avalokitesvara rifleensis TaxID=3367620 RepID=UPI0027131778|nr:DUF362 domain-containing protein [Candidatus Brocadiales bacterium]
MTRVAITHCDSYEPKVVLQKIRKLLDCIGGIKKFVRPGCKVLLKPNLLTAGLPEQAITTHPVIVDAVLRLVKQCGAQAIVGDSGAHDNWKTTISKSGLQAVCEGHGVPLINLSRVNSVPKPSPTFKNLELAETLDETEVVINLPKIKTHSQMYLTCAVKNLYGLVVGKRKINWHLKTGINHDIFADLIVEIADQVKPALTIADGILAMEGDGPGAAGTPRHLNCLIAGIDCMAMDRVVAELVGADLRLFYTHQSAKRKHIGINSLDQIELVGDVSIEELKVKDFDFPALLGVISTPDVLRPYIRHYLTAKPMVNSPKCILCRKCVEQCPTKVMSTDPVAKIVINYTECIRCACCIEVCPEGALAMKKGVIGKIADLAGIT